MNWITDRQGNLMQADSLQDHFLEWLYGHKAGRIFLRPLVSPMFSKLGGFVLSSRISRAAIRPFIRANKICMEEYEEKRYDSYNDFFTRKLKKGARNVDTAPESFVSPCDSKLTVYPIGDPLDNGVSTVKIKYTRYSIASLLRDRKLAERFAGGYLWVFRLGVEDYHHYIYTDSGNVSDTRRIPGIFHTVNPIANDFYPIYKENTREYALLASDHFGTILQMEVGALLVGKIENHSHQGKVKRGQEKGRFAFGGSTVILMTEKNVVLPDPDIIRNSASGVETKVRLGEKVGKKIGSCILVS